MATIKGSLLFVSSRAAQVSEVWVRAPRVRTHAEGVVTTGNDRFPVDGGEVEFTAVPGPAVLALISQGRAVDTIPILVGDAATQTLRQVVSAAKVADDATQREIEKLAAQAVQLMDSSTANARKAQDGATRAETAAGNAKQSETNAEDAARRASNSATSANRSSVWVSNAEKRTEESASAAATSASQAAESATSARNDADKVADTVDNIFWHGDRIAVNGKISPPLTGPKGDPGADGTMTFEDLTDEQRESLRGEPGPPGADGASTWEDITDKPSTFPPKDHKHTSADITDTTNDAGSSEFGGRVLVPRAKDGKIFYYSDPTEYRELARKGYVDSVGNTKADKSHKHMVADISDLPVIANTPAANSLVQRNPSGNFYVGTPKWGGEAANKEYVDSRIQVVSSLPSSPKSDVLYVITE